jgi:type IV secretion system protein VirB5
MSLFNRNQLTKDAAPPDMAMNPYLAARREWVERYGDYVNIAKIASVVAIVAVIGYIPLVYGLVHEADRTHTVTRIVEVNKLGQARLAEPVTVSGIPGYVVRHQIANWIVLTHEVISDPIAQKKLVDEATGMVTQSALGPLNKWWKPRNPMRKLRTESVDVNVTSAVPLSPHSYQVQWTQTTYTLTGRIDKVSHWQGVIGYTVIPPVTWSEQLNNPLGIYITHFAWNRIL